MTWDDEALAYGRYWPKLEEYLRACDAAYDDLSLESKFIEFASDTPTIICVARDEDRRMSMFIEHYQRLGAKSIHVIDNDSSDRMADIARSFAGVSLWRTRSNYVHAARGQLWVGGLARRHALGRWVLNVDADELFVYDQMGERTLSEVQEWVTKWGQERLFTPLIDVYSDSALDDVSAAIDPNVKFLFDGGENVRYRPYTLIRTQFGPRLLGGPRKRMMAAIGDGESPWLTKFALTKWDSKTAYANVHFPYPFDRNVRRSFGALLHLKLLGDFASRAGRAVFEPDYQRYRQWLKSSDTKTLVSPGVSVEYKGPQSLLIAGLIDPAPWRNVVQRGGLLTRRFLVRAAQLLPRTLVVSRSASIGHEWHSQRKR